MDEKKLSKNGPTSNGSSNELQYYDHLRYLFSEFSRLLNTTLW